MSLFLLNFIFSSIYIYCITFRQTYIHSICHSFCYFWYFLVHTLIPSHSYCTFIRRHSLMFFSLSSLLVNSVGKTYLWRRAVNRTRALLTADRRTTTWATSHPNDLRRMHPLSNVTPLESHCWMHFHVKNVVVWPAAPTKRDKFVNSSREELWRFTSRNFTNGYIFTSKKWSTGNILRLKVWIKILRFVLFLTV